MRRCANLPTASQKRQLRHMAGLPVFRWVSSLLLGLRKPCWSISGRGEIDTDPCLFVQGKPRQHPYLVALNAAQRGLIDYTVPVATWPPVAEIRQQLVNRYGTMLDQFPATKAVDYLVWEAVQVVARYADPATTPGPEHLGLAALIVEGVASDTTSANWDDLIEKAMRILVMVQIQRCYRCRCAARRMCKTTSAALVSTNFMVAPRWLGRTRVSTATGSWPARRKSTVARLPGNQVVAGKLLTWLFPNGL